MKYIQGFWVWIILFSVQVQAASLGVWPINPRIDPPQLSTSIWVKNNSLDETVVLQVRVLSWQQNNDQDIYESQDHIVVSPAMVKVAPGAQQLFRIVNRNQAVQTLQSELGYRVFIDEIPQPNTQRKVSSLNFQMRYSLPLFLGLSEFDNTGMTPTKKALLEQGLRYEFVAGKEPRIRFHNNSQLHVRLSHLGWKIDGRQNLLMDGLLGYVLPGSSKSWPLTQQQAQWLSAGKGALVYQQDRQELTIAAD